MLKTNRQNNFALITSVSLFILALYSNASAQELTFKTADGKFKTLGTTSHFLLDGERITDPKGNEQGLMIVIIRSDGKATKPVPVYILSKETKSLLFSSGPAKPAWMDEGLVGYFPFNGNGKNNRGKADDISGNGNHGTAESGTSGTADRFGKPDSALETWLNDGHIVWDETIADDWFAGKETVTFSIWMKPLYQKASEARQRKMIFAEYGVSDFSIEASDIADTVVHVNKNGLTQTSLTKNQWHHIALTLDGTKQKFFLDGQLVDEEDWSYPINDAGSFSLGGRDDDRWTDLNAVAAFDDLRIYDRALSSSEVKALYQYESTPLGEPPIGLNDGDDANLGGESSDESTQNKPTSSSENLSTPGMASEASGISSALRQALVAGDYEKALEIDPANPDAIELFRKSSTLLQTARSLSMHSDVILCVTYSPDGKTMASCGYDTVKLWNLQTGKSIHTLNANTKHAISVAFSPDGKRVVTCGKNDNDVKLWDVKYGAQLARMSGHTSCPVTVGFSPDGSWIFSGGSEDKTIRLWAPESGQPIKVLPGFGGGSSRSVAVSPDGKQIIGHGLNKDIIIWDVESGKELKTLKGHTDHIISVAVSHDGQWIASGSHDNTVKLWDAQSGKEIRTLKGHTDNIWGIGIDSQSKRIASAGADSTVRIWDIDSGAQILALKFSGCNSVTFSPNNDTFAAANGDGTIKIWSIGPYLEALDRIKKKYADPSD